jgi:hypothetical protein
MISVLYFNQVVFQAKSNQAGHSDINLDDIKFSNCQPLSVDAPCKRDVEFQYVFQQFFYSRIRIAFYMVYI